MDIGSLFRGFKPSTFELQLAFTGTGSGSVTQSPPSVVIKSNCRDVYIAGSVLSFIATPAENSVFTGWSEDVQGTELTCSVVMNAAKKVVANFSLITDQEKRIGQFVDNLNGTVTDTRTGLMWMRFAEGQRQQDDQPEAYSFDAAMNLGRKIAGYDDWRLPTVEELEEIVCYSRSNESFLGLRSRSICGGAVFWTSSSSEIATIGGVAPGVWCVSFFSGKSFSTTSSGKCLVQLVRNINLNQEEILGVNSKLAEIASQRIAPETATEWSGIGFEYLLRDIEHTDQPSATLIKALAKQPEIVSLSIGRLSRTLLHHAAAHYKLNTVKYLCKECRADINAKDMDGETPLDYALAVKATPIVDYLHANGGKSRKDALEAEPSLNFPIEQDVSLQIQTVGLPKVVAQPEQDEKISLSGATGSRFVDNGDGTVLDVETGLTWIRSSEGQKWIKQVSLGEARPMTIVEAKALRRQISDFNDWRLPTIEELKTLLADIDHKNAAIDRVAFPGTPASNYWSSSVDDGNWLLGVNFLDGKILVHSALNKNYVRLVRRGFVLVVNTEGPGEGLISINPPQNRYAVGTSVEVKAIPKLGSVFSRWSGDISNNFATCRLQINEDKHLVAHFEKHSFALCVEQSGTGSGVVDRSSDAAIETIGKQQICPAGASVTLIANPAQDSFFAGWSGSISGSEANLTIVMDAEKSVSANFQRKSFELTLSREGSGAGQVTCTPAGNRHDIGTLVTLTAIPNPGSVFSGWAGDVIGDDPTCRMVMASAKVLIANFSRLVCSLEALTAGSGTGSVTCNPAAEHYYVGDAVTLTASAATGSVFSGWRGAATGVDTTLSVTLDSDKTFVAEFEKLDIPNFDIAVDFVSAEHASMKSGDEAFILYLSIANRGQKQVRIELPLVSYVTHGGEEVTQDVWLTGLVIGGEGATVRAGTFRKAGLVFFKSKLGEISAGDQFYVSVTQGVPARRFDFSFRCTDSKSRAFTLISANVEEVCAPLETAVSTVNPSEVLQRLELLEAGLSDVLHRLEKLETTPLELIKNTENIALTVTSMSQVLAWLASQERVSIAGLRERLLPLDQFPGAFIDELNERALDLTGDVALDESGEEIIIAKEVLSEVIANLE